MIAYITIMLYIVITNISIMVIFECKSTIFWYKILM